MHDGLPNGEWTGMKTLAMPVRSKHAHDTREARRSLATNLPNTAKWEVDICLDTLQVGKLNEIIMQLRDLRENMTRNWKKRAVLCDNI